MKGSHSPTTRHPGESREPLNKCNAGSAALWIEFYRPPALAGVTVMGVAQC